LQSRHLSGETLDLCSSAFHSLAQRPNDAFLGRNNRPVPLFAWWQIIGAGDQRLTTEFPVEYAFLLGFTPTCIGAETGALSVVRVFETTGWVN
jgi:hypothetical protein